MAMKKREEHKKEDTWNVAALFTKEAWKKEIQKFKKSKKILEIASFKENIHSAQDVKKLFDSYFEVKRIIEKLYTYAHLRLDEDLSNDQNKELFDESISLFYAFEQQTAWISPSLLQQPLLQEWMQEKVLSSYKFLLQRLLRMQPYVLSIKEEKMLATVGKTWDVSHLGFSALSDVDMKFAEIKDKKGKKHELTHGSYLIYMRSEDRTLRKNAFTTLLNSYKGYENTFGELLKGQLQNHVCYSQIKGYKSSLEAALYPHNIPTKVYDNLLDVVNSNVKVLHRYVRLKKKFLRLKTMHLYDIYAPITNLRFHKTYKQAQKMVIDATAILGEEYQAVVKEALLQKRWVDPFENQNKRSGAYSSGCYDSYPYILLNFHGSLNDVLTLAHEMGHSMHSYYSRKTRDYHYADYPIFVAEVASTFNEQLLYDQLLQNAKSDKEKLFYLCYQLDGLHATFFRQSLFAEFEYMVHTHLEQEKPLTPALMKKMYFDLYKRYYGKDMTVDEEIAMEWSRIPHFYYNFYVYQYATGIAAAIHLYKEIIKNNNKREDYLTFISKGGSCYAIDQLKQAGVDLQTKAPIKAAVDHFSYLMNEIEKLCT